MDTNRDQWSALLRNPQPVRNVALTVGIDKGVIFPTEVNQFRLRVYDPGTLYTAAALFGTLLCLFLWMAVASDVLRESGPPPPPARSGGPVPRRAYSLARVQMAVWFFVVAVSFTLIWLITFGLDTISPNVLALIGISAGTGLAAAVVDSGKSASMQTQRDHLTAEDADLASTLTSLAAKTPPLTPDDTKTQKASQDRRAAIAAEIAVIDKQMATPAHTSFIIDILSDANGISFHRFQMAVWTLILVVVFDVSVWRDLVMPEFSPTLLGLMGISSGTYIGFKFPEVKN